MADKSDARHFLKDICNEYLEDDCPVNGKITNKTTQLVWEVVLNITTG